MNEQPIEDDGSIPPPLCVICGEIAERHTPEQDAACRTEYEGVPLICDNCGQRDPDHADGCFADPRIITNSPDTRRAIDGSERWD